MVITKHKIPNMYGYMYGLISKLTLIYAKQIVYLGLYVKIKSQVFSFQYLKVN